MKIFFIIILLLLFISCTKKTFISPEGIEYLDIFVPNNTTLDTVKLNSPVLLGLRIYMFEDQNLRNLDDWSNDSSKTKYLTKNTYTLNSHTHSAINRSESTIPFEIKKNLINCVKGTKRIMIIPSQIAELFGNKGRNNNSKSITKVEIEILDIFKEPSIIIRKKNNSKSTNKKILANEIVNLGYSIDYLTSKDTVKNNPYNKLDYKKIFSSDKTIPYFIKQALKDFNAGDYIEFEVPEFKSYRQNRLYVKLEIGNSYPALFVNPWEFDDQKIFSSPSGFKYKIYQYGQGDEIKKNDLLTLHYSIYDINNKYLFSTKETDVPYKFIVDSNINFKALNEIAKLTKKDEMIRFYLKDYDILKDLKEGLNINTNEIFIEMQIITIEKIKANKNETL